MKAGPERPKATANAPERPSPLILRPLRQTVFLISLLILGFAVISFVFREQYVFQGDHVWITLFLATALVTLGAIDLDRFLLPDWLTLPLIILGLGYSYLFGVGLIQSGAGAIAGYALIAGLAYYWRYRFGREGIGLGDAKLFSAAGAWLGIFSLPLVLLAASGFALVIIAVFSILTRKSVNGRYIPFGPFIILAFWGVWCAPVLSV